MERRVQTRSVSTSGAGCVRCCRRRVGVIFSRVVVIVYRANVFTRKFDE